jgi:ribosomal-protein-alanine N-acetyltransferase
MQDRFVLAPLGAPGLDAAAALHRAAFEPLGERTWTHQDIAELLATPGTEGLLIGNRDGTVGFVLFRVAADEAEVLTIAVDPACRRQGAGRRLLDAAVGRVRSRGARALYLEVGADNGAARALYGRVGFSEVGRRAAYYRRGDRATADAVVMCLRLVG